MKVKITSMDLDQMWYIRDPRPRGRTDANGCKLPVACKVHLSPSASRHITLKSPRLIQQAVFISSYTLQSLWNEKPGVSSTMTI